MATAYADYPQRPLPDTGEVTVAVRPRISWSAIIAGVVLVLSIQILLSVLGAGIGFGMIEPGQTPDATTFGTGAGIWWLASTVIAFVFASYVSARLAQTPTRFDGFLHGLVIWSVTLLLTFYLLTSTLGTVIGGAFNALGSTVQTVTQSAGSALPQMAGPALPDLSADALRNQAQRLLNPNPNPDPATLSPEDASAEVARLLPDVVRGGEAANAARERIVTIMAAQLGVDRGEAERRYDEAVAQFQETRDQAVDTARQAADTGATAASGTSYLAFAALLIGAIAAGAGGGMASPRRRVDLG